MRPRVGHIHFINCFPLFYGLIEKKVLLDIDLIKGTPSDLNRMLREGQLDMAPISSIEYARHHKDLILMPDISISAETEVMSILLVSKIPINELGGKRVALTNTSATSQVLTKIILGRKYGLEVEYFESPPELRSMLLEADAALLIGDPALRAHYTMEEKLYIYDLVREWHEYNGHSMVFAVWAINREYAEKNVEMVDKIKNGFLESMRYSLDNIKDVACKCAEWEVFSPEYLEEYFATLKYDFNTSKQAGLLAYYREAHRMGLLEEVPELVFLGG
ncbi:MAG: menaquinone biosynthetic enzyme MqnA/MqnD family protein [Candidatus Saccharibacteria bacterium]